MNTNNCARKAVTNKVNLWVSGRRYYYWIVSAESRESVEFSMYLYDIIWRGQEQRGRPAIKEFITASVWLRAVPEVINLQAVKRTVGTGRVKIRHVFNPLTPELNPSFPQFCWLYSIFCWPWGTVASQNGTYKNVIIHHSFRPSVCLSVRPKWREKSWTHFDTNPLLLNFAKNSRNFQNLTTMTLYTRARAHTHTHTHTHTLVFSPISWIKLHKHLLLLLSSWIKLVDELV
jgi:hypothetical protein